MIIHGVDTLKSLKDAKVWTGAEIPRVYYRDMLTPNRGFSAPDEGWPPEAVIQPKTTGAVAETLREVRALGQKLVLWGGGTGLMGSAAALRGEIILDLSQLDRVLAVDASSRRIHVQPGATLGKVEQRAGRVGLVLGHDPWTRDYATVGGAISTNGLGYLAPRYGSMGDMVLGLTMVLTDGTIVTQRPSERASGFNASMLAVGMEGTLGIITEVVLRLRPKPERQEFVSFGFPDFRRGWQASREIFELGPALFDFTETFKEGAAYVPGGEEDFIPTMYLAFEGAPGVVQGQLRAAAKIARSRGGKPRPRKIVAGYWEGRHAIADMVARDRRGKSKGDGWLKQVWFDYIHVALPSAGVPVFRDRAVAILPRHGVVPSQVGLFTHPDLVNVYFLRPRGAENGEGQARLASAFGELMDVAHALGGRMEYCHGVGARLEPFLAADAGNGVIVYDRIKQAIDAEGILPKLGRR